MDQPTTDTVSLSDAQNDLPVDPYATTDASISDNGDNAESSIRTSSGSKLKGIVKGATSAVKMSRGKSMEEEVDDFHPQDDIYSLLFITPFSLCSATFIYCIFFVSFQVVVILLIAADLLSEGTPRNWLAIPHGVGILVSVSQVFCLFIAVITQQDVLTSLYLASVGYHPTHVPPTASRGKWIFALTLRFLLGMSVIFLSFVFIVQSESVIDLFKDFAAVTFVAAIDDAAFELAKMGFITDGLRHASKELEQVRFAERDDSLSIRASKATCRCRFRQLFLLGVFTGMVAYWGVLYSQQRNGDFITTNLTVQFGDEVYQDVHYAFFSGEYVQAPGERIAQRPVYYERGAASNRTSGRFFYCEEEEAWVFAIAGIKKSEQRDSGCNWLLKSLKTSKYDLSEVHDFGWKVWTGRVEEADFLRILPADCSSDADCNYHGQCMSAGQCECDTGWLGKNCRFKDTNCWNLIFYVEAVPVQRFSILLDKSDKIMTAYGRPIYYGQRPDDGKHVIILFTGRRWFITIWNEEELLNLKQLREALSVKFFHAFWTKIYQKATIVFSAPTESIMPAGDDVSWDLVSSSKARGDFGAFGFWRGFEFASIHCQQVDCSIPLVCGLNGTCQNETCVCRNGTSGHFCQFPFNSLLFDLKQAVSDTAGGGSSSNSSAANDEL